MSDRKVEESKKDGKEVKMEVIAPQVRTDIEEVDFTGLSDEAQAGLRATSGFHFSDRELGLLEGEFRSLGHAIVAYQRVINALKQETAKLQAQQSPERLKKLHAQLNDVIGWLALPKNIYGFVALFSNLEDQSEEKTNIHLKIFLHIYEIILENPKNFEKQDLDDINNFVEDNLEVLQRLANNDKEHTVGQFSMVYAKLYGTASNHDHDSMMRTKDDPVMRF